ncbi:MAG: sulfite exporter TauE/SafE family protein [Anaerolineales bacterium]|nr:sulfite exporter TauE/SafE family protein [Anaerolineales bacterium]
MNSLSLLLLVLSILFLATLIRSAFGFGNALLAMPLLILLLGVKAATPLVALVGLATALVMLIREWQALVWKDVLLLLFSSLAGIPLGLYLLTALPETIVKVLLGLILIGFSLFNLVGLKLPYLENPLLAVPFGFLSGILGGAYNANGPPIVIYGMMRNWKVEEFRATLQGFFLITSLMIAAGHGLTGLWTWQVLLYSLGSLPLVVLAVFLGDRITSNLSQGQFNRAIYIFLIVMGLLMFL